MSDTQTLEGIKSAAPEGATHYHRTMERYFKKYSNNWWRFEPGMLCLHIAAGGNEAMIGACELGYIIALDDIQTDDMAESMPFELLDGDQDEPRSKYHREIKPGVFVDVYDVLQAWAVTNPGLQHLIKKALAPGQRGHKDLAQDMDDIVASAERARELSR